MDNKTNLSPELKSIYDRVMSTVTKKSPTIVQSPPLSSTPPPPPPTPTEKPFTTPTFPYVATVPVIKIDETDIDNTALEIPEETNPPAQSTHSTAITPLPSMTGTIKSDEPKKSQKTIFISLAIIFIMAWTGLWAVFFGFIKI